MATIQGVYVALFGRPADPTGLNFFNSATNNGADLTAIGDLTSTAEYQQRFAGQSNQQIITSIYQSLFDRNPEQAGLDFFSNALANGTFTVQNIAIAILDGAQGDDLTLVNKKIAAADLFTAAIDTPDEIAAYQGTAAGNQGIDFLEAVTSTSTVVDAAAAQAAVTALPSSNSGQSFALTNNVDLLTGTAGDDTFIAGLVNTNATLNAGDTIDGGGGTDRLNTFGNANATAFNGAAITSIENVFAQLATGALNVSNNADVMQAWNANGSTGANTITLTKAQTGGLEGSSGTTATFTFSDATAATGDEANIALDGATTTTGLTVANIETLNLAATGKNTLNTLTATSASKVVITGTGTVSTTLSNNAAYKAIDASGNSGGVTIDASAANVANQVLDVKGSSKDDSYTTLAANLTKDDKIDLGDGTMDILAFGDAANFGASAANLAGVSNVEALQVNGALLTVDGDLVSQKIFIADEDGGDLAITDALSGTMVKFLDGDFAASAVGLKLGNNTLDVELTGDATDEANLNNGLTVTGSSTINVASAGQATAPANVLVLTAADNNTLNITGSKDLTLTANAATGTTGFTIDASTFTGKLDMQGTAAADVIKGGSGADTLDGRAGVDILTGNGGADTFEILTTDVDTTAGAVTDEITDFVSGTDKIDTTGAAGTAANYVEAGSAAADLATLLAAADAALAGAVIYYAGQVGSDSYLVTDFDQNGYTDVIKLTGVGLDGIAFGDLIA